MTNEPYVSWPGWEVVRLIGRGSFGTVYEIQRTLFDDVEKAALKVISIPQNDSDIEELYNDGYDDESITATFHSHLKSIIAEYSLMRKMNGSSHIVNCDDVSYVPHANGFGWDIYIKMELLTPLSRALTDPIGEDTVLRVAHDLCQALVLCKKHEIVHRDIKPQNIFVSPNGDYKLGDFGIAKTVEKTTGGTKIGTYKYMAPEIYHNRPYGSGADIYSLGLVLYWLLNERRLPFMPLPPEKPRAGQEEEARLRRFNGETIPAPAHGSDGLKTIVLKACAYDPKERYASAEEMLAAVKVLMEEDKPVVPVIVPPVSVVEPEKEPEAAPAAESVVQEIPAEKSVEEAVPAEEPAAAPEPAAEAPEAVIEKVEEQSASAVHVAEKAVVPTSAKDEGENTTEAPVDKEQPTPKKKKIGLFVAVGALCVLLLLVVGFFTVHFWEDATCTEPATCTLCGKTEGEALGHSWSGGTCTRPMSCKRCGTSQETVPGHVWQTETFGASFNALSYLSFPNGLPRSRKCTQCGITEYLTEFIDEKYEYDATGKLVKQTDANFVFEYKYDSEGKLFQRDQFSFHENGEFVGSYFYEYDSNKRLSRVYDSWGPEAYTSYEYDDANRLVKATKIWNGHSEYRYNNAGQLEEVIDYYDDGTRSGFDTSYEYYPDGKLYKMTVYANHEVFYWHEYKYDENGICSEMIFDETSTRKGERIVPAYEALPNG